MGRVLRQYGSDEDIVMTSQYVITLHFHDRYPQRLVDLPYASIAEIEPYAAEKGVSLIAISDRIYPHWPINALFHGAAPPANWVLLRKVAFSRETRFGPEEERYLLFRRGPLASATRTKGRGTGTVGKESGQQGGR